MVRKETDLRGAKQIAMAAVIAVVASIVPIHASRAGASEPCGTPGDTDGSTVAVDLRTSSTPIENPDGCIDIEVAVDLAPADGTDPDCARACLPEHADLDIEVAAASTVGEPGGSSDDPAIYSSEISFEADECWNVINEIGSCDETEEVPGEGEETEPDPESDPEPQPDPEPARAVALHTSQTTEHDHKVVLAGAVTGPDRCSAHQPIQLLAKKANQAGFRTLRDATTDSAGSFRFNATVAQTTEFVVAALAGPGCSEVTSSVVTVDREPPRAATRD